MCWPAFAGAVIQRRRPRDRVSRTEGVAAKERKEVEQDPEFKWGLSGSISQEKRYEKNH
jgi:hypothetical protein